MHITIWTLNRATDLLEGEEDSIRRLFAKASISVSFGDRSGPSGASSTESVRELMPDTEYFVPIPLKCIGSKYASTDLDPEGQALLDGIVTQNDHLFGTPEQFKRWWEDRRHIEEKAVEERFGSQYMRTDFGVGYYQLLEPHDHNVLIGYSQGGLVSRYLAFLDRHVFKQNRITAAFTIGSPNYGSPLANPENCNSVAAGLIQFLVAMLSFHHDRFPQFYGAIGKKISFGALYDLIAQALEESNCHEQHGAHDLLETIVKWFSGLKADRDSAFDELDILNLYLDHSVLTLVNGGDYAPSGVYTGSVVTANADLDEILKSVLIGERTRTIKEWLIRTVKGLVVAFVKTVRLFGIRIGDNVDASGEVYAEFIMEENLPAEGHPIIDRLVREYLEGVSTIPKVRGNAKALPPRAHDFIVPSVYQLLPDDERLLGQYLNLDASHNSGKSQDFRAGRQNVDDVKDLLKRLRESLRVS